MNHRITTPFQVIELVALDKELLSRPVKAEQQKIIVLFNGRRLSVPQ